MELVKTVSIVKNDTEAEDLLLENKDSVTEFDVQDKDLSWKSRRREKTRNRLKCTLAVLAVVLLLCVSFGVGLILGWKLLHNDSPIGGGGQSNDYWRDYWGSTVATRSISQWIPGKLVAENIRNNLKTLTSKPHISGKDGNADVTDFLYNTYSQYQFDSVYTRNYSVLLSYVNRSNYNSLQLLDSTDGVLYTATSTIQETPLTDGENDTSVPPPFNAYSAPGEAKGPLVYVNYGRISDFQYLVYNLSLNLTGYVCIARYGRIFRGDKAHLAQRFGCSGLIIYSDPADYAPKNGPPVYPKGPSLPPGGVQRGSVMLINGDPLTPSIPAIDGVYRRTYEDFVKAGDGPAIPVQPISYGDAIHFMSQLDSIQSPDGWRGELDINYMIHQSDTNKNLTLLKVNNIFEIRTICNVFAVVYGSMEPDSLVLLGNHYDAWTFGAVDPNSGTAVILEVARVIDQLRSTGWRPGRTIVLCSWDSEEFGLIGSTEWVEDMEKFLVANAVAYLNVDEAVADLLAITFSPLLYDVLYNATKQVQCPCDDYSTLYDKWKSQYTSDEPRVYNLGAGTDHAAFVQRAGVTCSGMAYVGDYPVYHSVHDNYYWMTNFADPSMKYSVAMGELWTQIAMAIATTPIIPYNPVRYYERLLEMYNQLESEHGSALKQNNITTALLKETLDEFQKAAASLNATLAKYQNTTNLNIIRMLNKKLINIERAFILPEGLPGRPYLKHVIFAPSSVNSYSGASFPGVTDAIFNATSVKDWEFVHQQLDIVAIHIRYATQIMNQSGTEWIKTG
uniref:Aminopeptidase NAALADL1 n=1 Tax=Amphimedon queenslandica TaxID=400682 RepID=A0A1X7V380_AMPQE